MSRTKKAAQKYTGRLKRKAEAEAESPQSETVSKKPKIAPTKEVKPATHHASIAMEADSAQLETVSKKPESAPTKERKPATYDASIAMKDPALLADLFAQTVAKHYGDSTVIEQQDISISKQALQDTTDFDKPHISANLPAYLEQFVAGGKAGLSKSETEGTPNTLIVTSSGIRVADLTRELRVYNNESTKVAKFIAKHMKLKLNIEYVKKTKIGVAVGTPARIIDLIEHDALKLTDLKAIVIDASYQDEKRRTMMDMAELFKPLMKLLAMNQVQAQLEAQEGAKVLVF